MSDLTALEHGVHIHAPVSVCFDYLTQPVLIARWQQGAVSGSVSPGETLRFHVHERLLLEWKTIDLQAPHRLVQSGGRGQQRTLSFLLESVDEHSSRVKLSDSGWRQDDPHRQYCNTAWGAALMRMREVIEREQPHAPTLVAAGGNNA